MFAKLTRPSPVKPAGSGWPACQAQTGLARLGWLALPKLASLSDYRTRVACQNVRHATANIPDRRRRLPSKFLGLGLGCDYWLVDVGKVGMPACLACRQCWHVGNPTDPVRAARATTSARRRAGAGVVFLVALLGLRRRFPVALPSPASRGAEPVIPMMILC